MKKYKFKLEGLLKMRKLEEEQCKLKIGKLQKRKNEILEEIRGQKEGIAQAYASQEATVQNGASGMDLRFYPYFVQGKRAATKKLEEQIERLDELLAQSYEELKELRGRAKVLEEMKDKGKKAHKKKADKEMHQKIEEQVMNWSRFQTRNER